MPLTLPPATQNILEEYENSTEPTADCEIEGKLSGIHQAEGLTADERKGARAEATAFNLRLMDESPWHTRYGPIVTSTKQDGTPYYDPDIAEIDEEMINHWEQRSAATQHPLLRARYADVTWDLKKAVTGTPATVQLAHRALDAYLDGVVTKRYKEPIVIGVQACQRALDIALTINDKNRIAHCKTLMLDLFLANAQPGHIGVWATLYDALTDNKKVGLTAAEVDQLINGLQCILDTASTHGGATFDPWSAEAAARRLAAHHERQGKKKDAQNAIRAYGNAFEQFAAQASPLLAMSWLQGVHEEYKNRGMNTDATRVQAASAEKGKHVASEMKEVRASVKITDEQMRKFVEAMTSGTPRDALLRIALRFIPKTEEVQEFLKKLQQDAPFTSMSGVTKVVGDHFAAQAGSIENDPEGRLIMQLAENIQIQNLFLYRSIEHLRTTNTITADTMLSVITESPIFPPERHTLLREGIQAYLDGDHIKAIHVLIPQIEQALRELLTLTGTAILKTGRNGMMQYKNLNDILRESVIKTSLGNDLRLYLLTFLADERGHNLRNKICHGLTLPEQLNEGLSTQTLHALLAVSLIKRNEGTSASPSSSENTPM